ncbi:hypothetical protein, partial [Mesorhizobium sp. M7A.F.Ca.CA.002.05.1.1]|uniref:hypothetical protein n=1 Tax=Mesorhizobium sp. M7A.F.Ca.CA.002.05.1.1 TaxID=2496704 RepID=UPI0019D007AA
MILILIGLDPIAVQPALLAMLLLVAIRQDRVFFDLVLLRGGHRAGAGTLAWLLRPKCFLPPDAMISSFESGTLVGA